MVFALLSLFAAHGLADEPKKKHTSTTTTPASTKTTPQADRIDGFTLTTTDFWQYGRGDGNGIHGIRHREFWASGLVLENMHQKKYVFRREEMGIGGDPFASYRAKDYGIDDHMSFERKDPKTYGKYSELYGGLSVEPTLEMLRDIFGTDAISDVQVTPGKDVGGQRDPMAQYWHKQILDALSKSGGDTMQAAARINLSEQQLQKKLKDYNTGQ